MGLVDFFHPRTLDEAKILLHSHEGAKVLAGGTDLILNLRRGDVKCNYLISLDTIEELRNIVDVGEYINIGAMCTFTDLLYSEIINENFNSLVNCSTTMGSPQIRNVATVGGNIINAGSAADVIPCIISLDGILVFESVNGIRRVTCEEYFNNYSEEKVMKDEILTTVIIPKTKAMTGYYKLGKRNSLAIARLSSAVAINLEEDKIKEVKICLGAVGRYPFRAVDLEKLASNKDASWILKEEALNTLSEAVEKSIGGRKTMPFKREAIRGVFKVALKNAMEERNSSHCLERSELVDVKS